MKLLPIVYVSDMERSIRFYRAFSDSIRSQSGMWTEFSIGDAHFALHAADPLPQGRRVDLAFITTTPLEQVVASFKIEGIALERDITDEAFGRSILVRDPDGLPIQINEYDPEIYA